MTNRQPASSLRQLRVLFMSGTATGLTDRQLLERFTAKRAESCEAASAAEMAFAALVDRHGSMVWGVCRRVLGDVHEAEDAFQATFLVLVRKAGSVRVDDSLGRWLYGVAHRVALRARSGAERRASCRVPTPSGSPNDPAGEVERGELCNILGEEVDRLPTRYRCPIELCDLQGMTYDQASRQLNWSVATVKGRLARGRLRLRERLSRRGLAPVSSGMVAALSGESRAALPQELVHSTIRATTLCATGVYPAAVAALVKGALRTMTMTKLWKVSCAGIVLGMAGIVGGTFIPAGDRPQASASTASGESRVDDPRSDLEKIQGTWIRVSTDGRKAEKPLRTVVKKATDRPDVDVPAGATVFDFNWEGGHNHVLLDPTKDPKTLDFIPEPRGEGVPKICPGIYKLEGDVLTICFLNINGKRPTRFVAGGFGETLDVYERVNLPKSQQPAETRSSEKPRGNAAGDRRWVATLSNGATIEVIGVSSYPTGPDTWWRPDGTPLPQPPCDPSRKRISGDGDIVYRVVVTRLAGIPTGAEHRWGINQSSGNSQGPAALEGKPVPGLYETVALIPSGTKAGTARFEVAAGPWETVQTWGTSQGGRGSRNGPSYIFGEAIATKKGTALPVTHNIRDVSVRLVAVDRHDKEHPAEIRSNSGVGDFHQLVGEFDLPPEQIKEFRVQTRPYEKVELQGVALKPAGAD